MKTNKMKNLDRLYEALRIISDSPALQEKWEKFNNLLWESEFDFDLIKESDFVVYPDSDFDFLEPGTGKLFANQNAGFVIYEAEAHDLSTIEEIIADKMCDLRDKGHGSDDC